MLDIVTTTLEANMEISATEFKAKCLKLIDEVAQTHLAAWLAPLQSLAAGTMGAKATNITIPLTTRNY